ncbi:MAG TPA: DUF3231 family protein [Bacillus sp. (in: firmicutes)]|uniref:DUF3231 family protein n=1 Tax=Bacillus litorisediminis TaxID=2922713 RepID=UPI001FAF9AC9|nr:DUF3231 family protein [Bacillus litorisediminis]HWO77105.1 DUF3231 family protein [Bacillus sp. (in: firmicutes)]
MKAGSNKTAPNEKLTSAEMGKLWATYMGNSMAICVLSYFLQHVEDQDVKNLLEHALKLSKEFINTTKAILEKENFPIPDGFGEKDVNMGAPRLFEDQYYVHYLKYTAKAGMSIYSVGLPLMFRKDIEEFFRHCVVSTMDLMKYTKDVLISKGFIMKPPFIPLPEKVEYVHRDFLNGFFGHVRPMQALEIAHFYDSIETATTSRALLTAFIQVAKDEKIRQLLERGKEVITANMESFSQKLHDENFPVQPSLDHLVTKSAFSPFSDKLMLFHSMDMSAMKIRIFGNSLAVDGRHDIALVYTKAVMRIASFVEQATKLFIDKGWMEKPPMRITERYGLYDHKE